MMIKVNGGYLDFNDDIEVERQSKLFENLDETWGDFSYSFDVQKTNNNLDLLGYPFPDNKSKLTYTKIPADIISGSGDTVYRGFLRIERVTNVISMSFFAGNNNWISELTGAMIDLELSQYDQVMTEANIMTRIDAETGITFPIVDSGVLVTRTFEDLKVEDFVGSFYLHTLFKEVFQQSGLKINGELLNDSVFKSAVVMTNTRSKVEVDRNSVYVAATEGQTISGGTTIEYNLTTNPYYIGDNITFISDSLFQVNVDMLIDVEATYETNEAVFASLFIGPGVIPPILDFKLGDTNTLRGQNVVIRSGQRVSLSLNNFLGTPKTLIKSTFKITPRFIYKAFGSSTVPNWTKVEFVKNVLSLFNVITDYNANTRTVTFNLLNKIKDKPAVDISEYVTVDEVDYSTFISDYGKSSTLSYDDSNDEDLREYNIATFNKYGSGVITVNNEFLNETAEIVESDFTSPISYVNPVFGMSMEKIQFVELDEQDEMSITSVVDSSGTPQFNVDETDADVEDVFEAGQLVRIDSNKVEYNGDFIIESVSTSGYIVIRGLTYSADATGTIKRLIHNLTTDDSVYILINTRSRNVPDFSKTKTEFFLEGTNYSAFNVGFFNLINNDTQFNTDYKQGLSFGEIVDPLFYQRTLIDTYWRIVERILNDPVKLICTGDMPISVYKTLTPLTPVFVKTEESTNMYYVQRTTGYKESYLPFTLELIKLP